MKKLLILLGTFLFTVQLVSAMPESAPTHLKPVEKEEMKENKTTRGASRKERRLERFTKRWNKLLTRIEKKKTKRTGEAAEVWDDDRFRLGVILLAGALALAILAILISLGGLLNFIAGLLALGGIVLVIWSLIEYYA